MPIEKEKKTWGDLKPTITKLDSSADEETDYYKALKEENYKALLSKEIQLDNARQRALKNTQTQINAAGMGSSGYGMTAQTGIESQYISALESAGQGYQQQENAIKQQERDETLSNERDNFESITTLMGSSQNSGQLNDMLLNAGFLDANGGWTDKVKSLNENDRLQLQTLYNMYSTQLKDNEWVKDNTINGQGFKDIGSAMAGVVASDGKNGENIANEIKKIFSDEFVKGKPDGYVVKLVSGKSGNPYAYMIYRNGAWYQTSSTVYANAEQKEELKAL